MSWQLLLQHRIDILNIDTGRSLSQSPSGSYMTAAYHPSMPFTVIGSYEDTHISLTDDSLYIMTPAKRAYTTQLASSLTLTHGCVCFKITKDLTIPERRGQCLALLVELMGYSHPLLNRNRSPLGDNSHCRLALPPSNLRVETSRSGHGDTKFTYRGPANDVREILGVGLGRVFHNISQDIVIVL